MISWMAMDFFAESPVLFFPIMALFVFMAVFAGVTVRAIWMRRDDLEELAHLPLDENEELSHE